MSATAALRDPLAPVTVNRPDVVSVGTIVWLSSEVMFFAGLFAMYFTIRAVVPDVWQTAPQLLDVGFAATNTGVLVSSSFTCQMGVFAAERYQPARTGSIWDGRTWGMREWYVLTFLMGAFFVGGQVFEYAGLVSDGLSISSSPYGSVFYMTTGFHGLHVTAGLVAFLVVIGRSFAARRFGHQEATSAVVTSYYWHFVDIVWIALFFIIYVIK